MTIVTLVKVVPELDKMTFDPATKTMRRAGAPLILNPFDEHAATLAPSLRTSGEEAVLVCMGPPDARGPMTRALALGSDRAILISDRALAGSDTWVTSRVLSATLRPLRPRLILAGRCSTDSSTGQVTSQIAEMLDMPMVDGAGKIARGPSGTLEAVAETDAGWERFEIEEPCLVSVSEKVNKIRFPKPRELNEAAQHPFEVRSAPDPGLAREGLGLAGSPTQVLSLENEEPTRSPVVFAEGTMTERVRRAADRVRALLAQPRPPAAALRRPLASPDESGEVLVLASSQNGGLDRDALPLVSEVLRLPEPLWPSAVGFGPLSTEEREALARAGASRAWWWPDPIGWLPPMGAARLVADLLRERSRSVGALFLSTGWAREVAGRVSSRLAVGLTGDAVGISWEQERGLVFHKPSFGGGLVAKVVSKRSPTLATIRPGSFESGALARSSSDLTVSPRAGVLPKDRIHRSAVGSNLDPRFGNLDHARAVVGVGMGVGGAKNVEAVLEAIRPLHAALGASRRVVDEGWVPAQLQVGLTGRAIAPVLYVAVGVSGQVNHMVGVKRAQVIVGINSRMGEPLFASVDVGILGDALEVLPGLVRDLAPVVEQRVGGRGS